jgi:hypothetical protein
LNGGEECNSRCSGLENHLLLVYGSSMPELRRTLLVCLSSEVGRLDFAEKVFELIFVRDWLEAENTYLLLFGRITM